LFNFFMPETFSAQLISFVDCTPCTTMWFQSKENGFYVKSDWNKLREKRAMTESLTRGVPGIKVHQIFIGLRWLDFFSRFIFQQQCFC
jgi:hypothetical protein